MGKQQIASKEFERRRTLIEELPEFATLRTFVTEARQSRPVVWPDPCDGGTSAKVLLLAINPTIEENENQMASLDLLHPAFLEAFEKSGLQRKDVMYWSVVPWSIRSRFMLRPGHDLVNEGIRLFGGLTALMPNLKCVVLLGQFVWSLQDDLARIHPNTTYIQTWAPDRRNKITPDKEADILEKLQMAAKVIGKRNRSLSALKSAKEEVRRHEYAYA